VNAVDRPGCSERGAAALEFAIVAPVILLMIFGIIQYGYLYWSLQTASATAREAARQLIVGTREDCVTGQAVSQAGMPAVGAATPSMTRVYYDATGAPTPNRPVVGGLVTVTVSFQSLDMHLPLVPVPHDGVVTQSASARIENIPPSPLLPDDPRYCTAPPSP